VTGTIGYSCKNTLLLRCLICCLLLSLTTAAAALDPVNLHVSAGISPNTLIYRFTNEKGFYREEGLELLPIQAGMLPGIQGLVGGSFHVSQILGQAQELQRLAALVPRPRLHLIRFHGVLAPNAKLRSEIIPSPVEQATEPACDHAQAQGAPATFNEIYEHLGPHVKQKWAHAVVPLSQGFVSKGAYCEALDVFRPALQKRYEDSFRSNGIEGLIYPTTPTVAPKVGEGEYTVAGKVLDTRTIGKNGFASSCAGLPGISLPMGLSSDGLPIGLEIDGQPNSDPKVLDLATRISRILGSIPPPSN
jgi:hypothetical protein